MNQPIKKVTYSNVLPLFFIAILFASLILSKSMDTMNLLVLFGVISIIWGRGKCQNDACKTLKQWWWLVFICFFGVSLIPLMFHGSSVEVWQIQINEKVAPLIAIFFMSLILFRMNVQANTIWLSLLIVPIAVLVSIAYEYCVVGEKMFSAAYRFGGNATSSTLLFGVFSSLLIAVLGGAAVWSLTQKKYFLFSLYVLGAFVLLYGTILTGTRGAWLGLPEIVIGWLLFAYFSIFRMKSVMVRVYFIAIIISVLLVVTFTVHDKLQNRLSFVVHDVEQYFLGYPDTSIGKRFLMYEGALEGVSESFLFGVGSENVASEIERQTRILYCERFGWNQQGLEGFWDVHNQYLQELFSRGIFSFLGLLVLQLYVLYFFIKKSSTNNIFAVTGVIFVISSVMTMMSYSWLRFHDGIFFYFLILTMLMYGSVTSEQKD